MATVLILLPRFDYDPTEAAVPWAALTAARHRVIFATPEGHPAYADRILTDIGFGLLSPVLMPSSEALDCYRRMSSDSAFLHPIRHDAWRVAQFDALLVPGGHAPGVTTLLDSQPAQACVVESFRRDRLVAAICHGPVLLARSIDATTGRSVLHGRRSTALTQGLEYSAFFMTALSHGRYYRTSKLSVETEVKAALGDGKNFDRGTLPLRRDTMQNLGPGFTLCDGNYLSARWPGDAHRFTHELLSRLP